MHPLICPVCGSGLARVERAFHCDAGHSFDIAREGYVNLLPSGAGSQKFPGDSAAMLRSRRAFLDRGHYRPLAEVVAERVASHLAADDRGDGCVAEIGSGEGYHIGTVGRVLCERGMKSPHLFGMDRSKDAARMAAKRYRDVMFFVADVWRRIPFADGSIRALLDIFSPRNPAEFARVMEPGGLLLVVIPGEGHLAELRDAVGLMGMEEDKEARVRDRLAAAGFRPLGGRTLEYPMSLGSPDLYSLVEMTPNCRHVPMHHLERLSGIEMEITASFIVLEYVRC